MTSKLTSAMKHRITRDWRECFPDLGEYQPMWLVKRAGCLLVGIHLERDSSNSRYRPTFHTHVLGKGFPVVTLTLAQALTSTRTQTPETIPVMFHEGKFAEACARMKEQLPMPVTGSLAWSDVHRAYRKEIDKTRYALELYEDLILVAAWWAPATSTAAAYFGNVIGDLSAWPDPVFSPHGGFNAWRGKFEGILKNRDLLQSIVSDEVDGLNLSKVPTFSLKWDADLSAAVAT